MKNIPVTLTLCLGLAAVCALAQDVPAPPAGPFQAVHLLRVDAKQPDGEKTLLKAIADMNEAIVKGGCKTCIYHLWKGNIDQDGSSFYLQTSSWPGRTVYEKVHNSPEYTAAIKNWDSLRSVVKQEIYNRYVELPPGK